MLLRRPGSQMGHFSVEELEEAALLMWELGGGGPVGLGDSRAVPSYALEPLVLEIALELGSFTHA